MLLNKRQHETSFNPVRKSEMKVQKYSFQTNFELNAANQNEIKYWTNLDYNKLLMHYENEIRIIWLSDMKIYRIIDDVPEQIESVGVYSDGIYWITSNNANYHLTFIDTESVSEPVSCNVESRILAHLSLDLPDGSAIVTVSEDKAFRVYYCDVCEIGLERSIYCINNIELSSVQLEYLPNSNLICWVINENMIIYINPTDWTTTYPISGEIFNISHIGEFYNVDLYTAFIWNDYEDKKQTKTLSLLKMPPENDQGNYHIENHKIPHSEKLEILDFVGVYDWLLILVELKKEVTLLQFKSQRFQTYSFNKLGSIHNEKHSYALAKVVRESYICDRLTGENSAHIHFIYPRWLEIETYSDFSSHSENTIGSKDHASKFQEHIQNSSKLNMIGKADQTELNLFTDEEIEKFLESGYFEYVGDILLYKEPGMDGYHTNMADLRDFIEKWVNKFQLKINNRLLPSVLKHFKPDVYGNSFGEAASLSSKLNQSQKSVESLWKIYKYILHRRVLEGKQKQANLKNDRLHMKDIEDIKMIDRRCFQIESIIRLLKYLKWFIDNSQFFVSYEDLARDVKHKLERKINEKKQHYKQYLKQNIKNLVNSDTLFIEKIMEESGVANNSPKASYAFLNKNSKFSDLKMTENTQDEQSGEFWYPLKSIEQIIVLLKATNLTKIQDYIILYTLMDMHFHNNETEFEALLHSLNLYSTYEEVKIYWTIDSGFANNNEKSNVGKMLSKVDSSRLQWHTSILQSLLELNDHENFNVFINNHEFKDKPRNSAELIMYGLCQNGKYNQAFSYLLNIEDELNPIRYKNIFKLYTNLVLDSGKFDLLVSQHLTQKQTELVKEYLQSDESYLHQLYYFTFIASRGSTLEGLKQAKLLIDKIKREKIDSNRGNKHDAEFIYEVLKTIIRMYSHTLPAVQKKFAFQYLNLEKGKYEVIRQTTFGIEYMEDSSDQGKYTPFLNKNVNEMMDMRIPKDYANPFENSLKKIDEAIDEGTKSVVKLFGNEDKIDHKATNHIDSNRGGFLNRFASPFEYFKAKPAISNGKLGTQKREFMEYDFGDDIAYHEQQEDIQNGKESATKFLNNLKSSAKNKFEQSKNDLGGKSKYEGLDLFGFRKGMDMIKKPIKEADQPMEDSSSNKRPITKESLLAGLPDRVISTEKPTDSENVEFGLIKKPIEAKEDVNMEVDKDDNHDQNQFEENKPASQKSLNNKSISNHSIHEVECHQISEKSKNDEPDSLMIPQNENKGSEKAQIQSEEESESSSSGKEEQNNIFGFELPKPKGQRRNSFNINVARPLSSTSQPDLDILHDSNTFAGVNQALPHFTNANDDIEFERRKREAQTRHTLNFLYAGNAKQYTGNNRRQPPEMFVGSDVTPEKDELQHRKEMATPMKSDIEEDKDDINVISEIQCRMNSEEAVALPKSEMIYDEENPLNEKISNRSIKETVRTENIDVKDEDRQTEGIELLEKVKRLVQKQSRIDSEQDKLDIVREVISNEQSDPSDFNSNQQLDNNLVQEPQDLQKDVVYQIISSESEESENKPNIKSKRKNSKQAKGQTTAKNPKRKVSESKFKGKKPFQKYASKPKKK